MFESEDSAMLNAAEDVEASPAKRLRVSEEVEEASNQPASPHPVSEASTDEPKVCLTFYYIPPFHFLRMFSLTKLCI